MGRLTGICLFIHLKQYLSMQPQLSLNSICKSCWRQTHGDLPASNSESLRFKVSTTTTSKRISVVVNFVFSCVCTLCNLTLSPFSHCPPTLLVPCSLIIFPQFPSYDFAQDLTVSNQGFLCDPKIGNSHHNLVGSPVSPELILWLPFSQNLSMTNGSAGYGEPELVTPFHR